MTEPRVLGVIPARGGSKRFPRKNLAPLAGKPLIQHTIDCARAARRLSRCIVSTDDPEIAEVARACGADVPFLRPAELATDTATSASVALHALRHCEAEDGAAYELLALLQPTQPLRRPADIDGAVRLLVDDPGCPAVITVCAAGAWHPAYHYRRLPTGRFEPLLGESVLERRMQDFDRAYVRTGAVYVTRREYLVTKGRLMAADTLGYEIEPERNVNIDEPQDLLYAEWLLARGG